MRIFDAIRQYSLWVLGIIILLIGFWHDLVVPKADMMFPASMFTVPYFILIMLFGIIYFFLYKKLKNIYFFWLKEIAFFYLMCCGLYFLSILLIDDFSPSFPLLRDILSPLESAFARYALCITQSIVIAFFLISIVKKNNN